MDDCGLADLGFVGNKFTRCKTLQDNITVWECLDRAIVNNECISLFPATRLVHLKCAMFDHKPIIIHHLASQVEGRFYGGLNMYG